MSCNKSHMQANVPYIYIRVQKRIYMDTDQR